ncbi:hypothetical protein QUA30_07555 [Microcoleus sp. Pol14C2]|uniref:hypothetical protein n=1 Tax=unclassified Microcoleus TaxID=2642155 RepID=UPI002FCF0A63
MSKIIYDVIQRFEVEDGVPRLISTNIQVIEGGEDLMSSAAILLKQMGFYDKFEEKRTSQYIGYRVKKPGKGDKRYQVVFQERKDSLFISIPQDILDEHILSFKYWTLVEVEPELRAGSVWVLPSKKDLFLNSIDPRFTTLIEGKIRGTFYINEIREQLTDYSALPEKINVSFASCKRTILKIPLKKNEKFPIETLSNRDSYVIFSEDKLFPYAWQVSISSSEVIEEFLGHFAKIIMEAK